MRFDVESSRFRLWGNHHCASIAGQMVFGPWHSAPAGYQGTDGSFASSLRGRKVLGGHNEKSFERVSRQFWQSIKARRYRSNTIGHHNVAAMDGLMWLGRIFSYNPTQGRSTSQEEMNRCNVHHDSGAHICWIYIDIS